MKEKLLINGLIKKFPNINYNFLGVANESPKWNYDFFDELFKVQNGTKLK